MRTFLIIDIIGNKKNTSPFVLTLRRRSGLKARVEACPGKNPSTGSGRTEDDTKFYFR